MIILRNILKIIFVAFCILLYLIIVIPASIIIYATTPLIQRSNIKRQEFADNERTYNNIMNQKYD